MKKRAKSARRKDRVCFALSAVFKTATTGTESTQTNLASEYRHVFLAESFLEGVCAKVMTALTIAKWLRDEGK